MKEPKQLCFSFVKPRKDIALLERPLQLCIRFSVLSMLAYIIVCLGIIWIRII